MATKTFNETHIENFAQPRPIPKSLDVLRHWMGSGHRAIDVGCGSGFYTELCRQCGNAVTGVDLTSQVQAVHARSLDVCQGSVEGSLPFATGCFTLALCIEVVEHLLQPDLMLAEIYRVLQPGGTLILSTPNYSYWVWRLRYLVGYLPVGVQARHFAGLVRRVSAVGPPPWRDPHIRFFNPAIIRTFLHQSGFTVEEIRGTFVAFPAGLAPYLPLLPALSLRVIGKLIGNLEFLGDHYPDLLAAGMLVRATRRS